MGKLHRPGPMDYLFLYAETLQQPMHVGCLLIYNASDVRVSVRGPEAMLRQLQSYKTVIAPFNYRLVTRWGQPHWLEDEAVDLAQHIEHLRLPAGASEQALFDQVGNLHERRMDRSRPLWRVWVISGLADGRYAVYWQMHHALLDGVSGVRMIAAAHATDPDQRDMPPFWAPDARRQRNSALSEPSVRGSAGPSMLALVRRSLAAQAMAGRGLVKNWLHERAAPGRGGMFHAPETPLNGRISGSRHFRVDSFSLSRVQDVARRLEGTVNDVVLVMVGRALQHYLLERGQLPKEPLQTLIPVSLRDATSIGGNEVGMIRVNLGTHQHSIEALIDEVRSSVGQQKALLGSLAREAKQLYTAMLLMPMLSHVATGRLARYQTANTLISNLPGSRHSLYWNGHEVEAIYPLSIALHECPLNFTLLSYRDRLGLGVVCCPGRVPDLHLLNGYLHQALAEIEQSQSHHRAA